MSALRFKKSRAIVARAYDVLHRDGKDAAVKLLTDELPNVPKPDRDAYAKVVQNYAGYIPKGAQ